MSTPVQPTLTMPSLPIKSINEFLTETQSLIENIVGPWNQILIAEKVRGLVTKAWDEVRPTVETLRHELAELQTQITEGFTRAGLSGEQLSLKLDRLGAAWTAFKENGTVRRLKELLGWASDILGSLVSALPGSEALKEFVDLIVKLIEG